MLGKDSLKQLTSGSIAAAGATPRVHSRAASSKMMRIWVGRVRKAAGVRRKGRGHLRKASSCHQVLVRGRMLLAFCLCHSTAYST
jgi:hypothetical protein